MPLSVEVHPEEKIIWATGLGVVTDLDLLDYVREELIQGGYWQFDEIFDLRGADLLDLTYQGLSAVAEAAAIADPDGEPVKIAILVSETVGLGISRMYQNLREGKGGRRATRIFWELSEALEWMSLPHTFPSSPSR